MEPIRVRSFDGSIPLFDDRLLPATAAKTAINCRYERGNVESINAPQLISIVGSGTNSFAYNGSTLLQFSMSDTDYVQSPVSSATDKFYFTDGITPKKSSVSMWSATRNIAIDRPATPITLSGPRLSGTDIIASVSYYYTYVTDWGEESTPSNPTAVVDIYDAYNVTLSGLSTGGYSQGVTKKRIYRLNIGNTASPMYQFVAEVSSGTTSYTDTKLAKELGEACQTEKWVGPPSDMRGLIYLGNGYVAGFSGNTVYISEPFSPYAFPVANQYSTIDRIVGLGHYNQALVILTAARPVILHGIDPLSMSQDNIPDQFPCVSKRSIVSAKDAVFFASNDGLYMCYSGGVNKLTRSLMRDSDWLAMNPSTIIGAHYDDKYYGFFQGTSLGFIIDYKALLSGSGDSGLPTYTELDFGNTLSAIKSVHVRPSDGGLYILGTSNGTQGVFRYGVGGNGKLSAKWRSKSFFLEKKDNPGIVYIETGSSGVSGSPVGCKFRINTEGYTERIFSGTGSQRLSATAKYSDIQFEVSDFDVVRSVTLGNSIRDVMQTVQQG